MSVSRVPSSNDRSLKEKCGVFAAVGLADAAHLTYLGLFALQHRGQEGAGIVCSDGKRLRLKSGEGLVDKVFEGFQFSDLPGDVSIGHVRYSTAGGSSLKNVQPFLISAAWGEVAIAHNGNLVNADALKQELEDKGAVFQTTSDTEVILHLMAHAKGSPKERLVSALKRLEGAFSLALLVRHAGVETVYAVKDRFGIRPLAVGKLGAGFVVASESVAFDLVGAEYLFEVLPGELIEISKSEMKREQVLHSAKKAACVFEWIYFSRPDSIVFGESVYEQRKRLGALLAARDRDEGLSFDCVMGVPDSGIPAALGYASRAGIPYELGLVRNHYIGRTFIQPHQSIRDFKVRIKQNPLRLSLQGKRVVVIDDSIIRGTTSKKIILMLRESGAKEVHLRISAPPTIDPCFYGIDTPQKSELIAANKSIEQIRAELDVDSLRYLDLKHMRAQFYPKSDMCDACFSGEYPAGRPS